MGSREWDMGAFGIWEFLRYRSRVSLGISTPSSPAWNSPGIPLELRPSRAVPHCGIRVPMECWAPFSLCHGFGKELENPRCLLPALGSSRGFFFGKELSSHPWNSRGSSAWRPWMPSGDGKCTFGSIPGLIPGFLEAAQEGSAEPKDWEGVGNAGAGKGRAGSSPWSWNSHRELLEWVKQGISGVWDHRELPGKTPEPSGCKSPFLELPSNFWEFSHLSKS